MTTTKRITNVLTVALVLMGIVATADGEAVSTGPVTITDFFGPGTSLDAEITDAGPSQYNGTTYSIFNAFDGGTAVWATADRNDYWSVNPTALFVDLKLMSDSNPAGVMVDGFTWDNELVTRQVLSLNITTSMDDTFGNGDDVTYGPFDVSGLVEVTHAITPTQAKYLQFRSVTVDNPGEYVGAEEIGLTGSIVPEPSTFALLLLGLSSLLFARFRHRR